MFFLYRLIINTILILSPIIIIFRILKNKEDPIRFKEKLGIFEKKKILKVNLFGFMARV